METRTAGVERRNFFKSIAAAGMAVLTTGVVTAAERKTARRTTPCTSPEQIAQMKAAFGKKKTNKLLTLGFDYPTNNYTLSEEELGSFVCYGYSDAPIALLKLGTFDSDYYEWSSSDGFWWGEFDDLGTDLTAGDYLLVLKDSNDATIDLTVTIPS